MSSNEEQAESPLDVFRKMRTSLRTDLEISRQLTRDEPVYVLYDPVNFQAHRLSLQDYRVVAELSDAKTLETCFQSLVASNQLTPSDEEDFYQYVTRLENLGLLSTSKADADDLYKRFEAKLAAERKSKVFNILFLTLPLANPDKFLQRTLPTFRFLFSWPVFLLWLAAIIISSGIVIAKWEAFLQPLNNILAVRNLLFMSIAFVALKVWHELGHGYACKAFGGRVPEMGCKLIVGMPLAYMDATSAWSFPTRMHRVIVMLGGMYFETLVAIPAALIWAWNPDSFIGSCAYQLIFMAGVATLFFNANPLMKYDGYFIFSDLIGIPNLKARSAKELYSWYKLLFLGIPRPKTAKSSESMTMVIYGIASSIYGITLMISIAAMVAVKFHAVGLLLAAFQMGSLLFKNGRKLFKYLLYSDETEAVRGRARVLAGGLVVGLPMLLLFFPVPTGLRLSGIVTAERASVVRAATAGHIDSIEKEVGTSVQKGDTILRLTNLDTTVKGTTQEIASEAARRAAFFISKKDIDEGMKQLLVAKAKQLEAIAARREIDKLTIKAPHDGRLVNLLPDYHEGVFVDVGESVAKVVSGKTRVRAWIDEDQLKAARIRVGGSVQVRMVEDADRNLTGTVELVAPVSASEFQDLAVTTAGEGDIPIDQDSGKTQKPLFQVLVAVPSLESTEVAQDARAFILVGRNYESVGAWVLRSGRKFVNSIFVN